jgi:hypothetical protein
MKEVIKKLLREGINNRLEISLNSLPDTLYHVTTNYKSVMSAGVLKAQSGLDKGGLGGTESVGVSLVTDKKFAINIYNELILINAANGVDNEEKLNIFFDMINDDERKNVVVSEYERTINVYNDYSICLTQALKITRNMFRFSSKPFFNIVIFNEKNIKNKDIGIIEVDKSGINSDTKIIKGVDKDLGEIRVLGDINLFNINELR